MKHVAKIEVMSSGTYILTLHSGAIIQGTQNLAETVKKLDSYTWPQPQLAKDSENVVL